MIWRRESQKQSRGADAILQRMESGSQGTFGIIVAGQLALYTGEPPWRDNQPNISCVPASTYWAQITYSPHFGRGLYLLNPTAPRSGIRIHPANLMGDRSLGYRCQLNGCIALGERIGWLDGQKAILLSAPAVRRFETHMGRRPFILEIRDPTH